MEKHFIYLFIFCVLATGLQAQDESFEPAVIPGSTTLLDTAFLMPSLAKRTFTYYFRKKGTAFLDMVVADKELLYVEVEEIPGIYLYSKFKVEEIKTDSLKNEAHSRFKFKFRNGSIFPRYVNIKIRHRIAPVEATYVIRDTIYVDTVIGNPVYVNVVADTVAVDKSNHKKYTLGTVHDSLRFEPIEIKSAEVSLGARLDFTHSSKAVIPFELPKDKRVFGWAYWVGVGDGAKAHFDGLTEILPTDWVSEGIETPLHAYAKGLIPAIPKVNIGEKVDFLIADYKNAVKFIDNQKLEVTDTVTLASKVYKTTRVENTKKLQGLSFHPPTPSYIKTILVDYDKTGIHASSGDKIYLCLSNPNDVTALTVHFKVVALVEKFTFEEQANQNK